MGRVLRHLATLVVACVVMVLLGIALLMGIGLMSGSDEVKVRNGSVLVVDLDLRITDAPQRGTSLMESLSSSSDRRMELSVLLDELDRAATDPRIRAVLVTGRPRSGQYASSAAALHEVRHALDRVRAQKPVLAYAEYLTQRQLLVMSGASELMLHPLGEVQWQGQAVTQMFLKDLFDRFGIRVRVAAIGKYKSAADMFTRAEISAEEREQLGAYLEDHWAETLAAVAAGRGVDVADLQGLAQRQPALSADEARQAGLIDAVVEYDGVLERLKGLAEWDAEAKTFAQVTLAAYAQEGASRGASLLAKSKSPRIAVVYVEGELANREGSGIAHGGKISRELRRARLDDEVKAVVLRVNSPGGGVLASDLIRREVELTRQVKPVVVSMGGLAASGGYWVSTAGNVIFADPSTLTGSIGVVKMMLQLDETLGRMGVNLDTVKTGPWADYPAGDRDWSEEERRFFERDARQVYDDFVGRVADGRRLARDRVEELAGGRIWSGRDALANGLVDRLGGMRDAIRHAAELAGVGDDYRAVHGPEPKAMDLLIQSLMRSLDRAEPVAARLSGRDPEVRRVMERFQRVLAPLEALDDPRHLYARLPFDLELP